MHLLKTLFKRKRKKTLQARYPRYKIGTGSYGVPASSIVG
jgi:hypothetical protein